MAVNTKERKMKYLIYFVCTTLVRLCDLVHDIPFFGDKRIGCGLANLSFKIDEKTGLKSGCWKSPKDKK